MDSEDAAKVAAELRAARSREGIPQTELAERIGVSESTIQRLESGKRSPRLDMLLRIAHTLGVNGSGLVPAFLRKDVA